MKLFSKAYIVLLSTNKSGINNIVVYFILFWMFNVVVSIMNPSNEYCLYIQKINVQFTNQHIQDLLETYFKIGEISSIQHVKKSGDYLSIFAYFSVISYSPSTIELFTSVDNGNSFKLVLPENVGLLVNIGLDLVSNKKTYWIARKKCMTNVFQLLLDKINVLEERITAQDEIIEQLRERRDNKERDSLCISESSSNDSLFSYF
jgi:hypothetical protein